MQGKNPEASRSPRGERGLKSIKNQTFLRKPRRSPRGERGLKYWLTPMPEDGTESLPSRGAWIEISPYLPESIISTGRSPRGERGLKYRASVNLVNEGKRRSPRGERGLK